jgi:precorrin-6Y C5,15-methyltransferase (decarboxylating)
MKPVSVIGIGLAPKDITQEQEDIINCADILIGGQRHLSFFKKSTAEKKQITKNLKDIVCYIKKHILKKTIVVLASGDPLYFGIGSFLVKSLGAEHVCIYPNITSVAAAFSRIKEPWHDVHVVSLHGRSDTKNLMDAIGSHDKIAVYTDSTHSPAMIAKLLADHHIDNYHMCVLEQLGTDQERIRWFDFSEEFCMDVSDPNMVVLKRVRAIKKQLELYLGVDDHLFDHENGLITKSEVRAVTLSKLLLNNKDLILWDLGAGSGSVSIEASLFITNGTIYAVEKNKDRICQIINNANRFHAHNIKIIHATLPEGLENLPVPDRIFIGGGGKDLKKIIQRSCSALKKKGVIVINTVLIQNIEIALKTLTALGFQTDTVQVQINKSRNMPWGDRLEAHNPVWIITGKH